MHNDYQLLREIVGNNLDSPGKGGNISVKSNDLMIIKPSGKDLKEEHIYSCMSLNSKEFTIKPSMEYKMHYNIKSKYVVHYHPLYILPYLCSDYIFNHLDCCVIDYQEPGDKLAGVIKNLESTKELKNIIFLRNHGVILHSDSIDTIKNYHTLLKNTYFKNNNNCYTPDDAVFKTDDELYMFKLAMERLAIDKGLILNPLSKADVDSLDNSKDEKYRKGLI